MKFQGPNPERPLSPEAVIQITENMRIRPAANGHKPTFVLALHSSLATPARCMLDGLVGRYMHHSYVGNTCYLKGNLLAPVKFLLGGL